MHIELDHPQTGTRTRAPGTCGELVQGHIDGRDFLVNCPIDLFSFATAQRSERPGLHFANAQLFGKVIDAITLAARRFGLELRHRLAVSSSIPRGKGMASSTADITAALAAVLQSSGARVSPQKFSYLVAEVEPSDCTNFDGIAHVNHLTGDLIETLPPPENLRVLIVDCGGEVDTIGFNRETAREVYRHQRQRIVMALALLKRGLRLRRDDWVAEAATESARLSQSILFKPQFETLLGAARDVGALGVNCAHSGTVMGVLYRGHDRLRERLIERVRREFGETLPIVGDHQIIGGGCFEH